MQNLKSQRYCPSTTTTSSTSETDRVLVSPSHCDPVRSVADHRPPRRHSACCVSGLGLFVFILPLCCEIGTSSLSSSARVRRLPFICEHAREQARGRRRESMSPEAALPRRRSVGRVKCHGTYDALIGTQNEQGGKIASERVTEGAGAGGRLSSWTPDHRECGKESKSLKRGGEDQFSWVWSRARPHRHLGKRRYKR
jgi:hypothetical protein